MIKVNEDGSSTLKFPKSIYSKSSIVDCLEVYSDFLSAKLEESDKVLRLTIKSKNYDDYSSEELGYEFANYLLALEKEKK